jgi:hypothetical protein
MSKFGRSTFNEPHTITDLKPHIGQAWPRAGVPYLIQHNQRDLSDDFAGLALSKLLAVLCAEEMKSAGDGCRSEAISQAAHTYVGTAECSDRSSEPCPDGNEDRHQSDCARSRLSGKEPRQ